LYFPDDQKIMKIDGARIFAHRYPANKAHPPQDLQL